MLRRADTTNRLWRSDSSDGGRTWSNAYPTGIPNPGSKPRLMKRKSVETWRVRRLFRGQVKRGDEPGYQEVLDMATPYLGEQQNEVLVLNVAKMVDFARRGADGIVNAVCFNCMLGTVSTAVTGRIREDHDGIPIANLVYSAVEGSQGAMLEALLHQVKTYAKRRSEAALAGGADEPPRDKGLLARLWLGG